MIKIKQSAAKGEKKLWGKQDSTKLLNKAKKKCKKDQNKERKMKRKRRLDRM